MSMVDLSIISCGGGTWQTSEHRPIEMVTITLTIITLFAVFVKAFSPYMEKGFASPIGQVAGKDTDEFAKVRIHNL